MPRIGRELTSEERLLLLEQSQEYLTQRVDNMARALWAASGSIVLAVVTFALGVISGVIG